VIVAQSNPRPRFLRSGRAAVVLAALLVGLFLFRPAVYHLRNRIAVSIGSALGRRVSIDNVHLRLLPRPGFDLEGLVIYDDPAFSAEPMIRAQEVSAAIRLRSLLRGRLEIATLSANEPSINLVRNEQGRWNLSSLLERNAQIPAAPTGKPPSERRPAFPYLEAGHARVNFKIGQTKKSYALVDADLALWQDSENSWGARIKAEPVRTDFNLTDTGLVQIDATWQRASSLRVTPLQISLQWRYGQLGQITKLLSGKDRGWRGGLTLTAQLSGTPEALRIESRTVMDDFHRYDIVDSENVRLAAGCSGQYNAVTSRLGGLLCESPVGGGALRVRGALNLGSQPAAYDLAFEAERVPVASMVRLLRQAKKQISADLTASGLLNADFRAVRDAVSTSHNLPAAWSGAGEATGVRLSSNANPAGNSGRDEIAFGTIPLELTGGTSIPSPVRKTDRLNAGETNPASVEPSLRMGPVALTMNAAAPVNTGGWISVTGYRFFLTGDLDLKNLFRLEDTLALPGSHPAAEGSAKLDVSVSGIWRGFAPPAALGTAQLRNVRAALRGLNPPLEINSATVTLAPDTVLIQRVSARIGNTHWNGTVTAPRHCDAPNGSGAATTSLPTCAFEFDLGADRLSTADLVEWFTSHPAKRPWYRILNSKSTSNTLLAIQAQGQLRVAQFDLNNVLVTQLATQVAIDQGKISLNSLRAQLLQGTHQGNWTIDLSAREDSAGEGSAHTARYHGSGTLKEISLAQLAALMNDDWITGTADGTFDVKGAAESFHSLPARSDGKLQFVMRNGALPHLEIPGASVPLPVHRFTGELGLKKGIWQLSAGRLETRDGLYQVSGTASPGNAFSFILTRGDEQAWTVTGTLAKPQVAPASRTVARRVDANVKP
jgi:AsmA family